MGAQTARTNGHAHKDDFDDLMTLQEGAKMCTVEYETFRRWVAKGVLPHVVIVGEKRVLRRDVVKLLRYVAN